VSEWSAGMWGVYAADTDEESPPVALFATKAEAEDWLDWQEEYSCSLVLIETECRGVYANESP
jgi:hypothetical protein